MRHRVEDLGRRNREATGHPASDKDLAIAEQGRGMTRTVFVHDVAFEGPNLGRGIENLVLRQESAFQRGPTNHQDTTIRKVHSSMIGAMKVHRGGGGKSLRDRVIDVALIVGAGPRKSTSYEHGSVRKQIHLMTGARCKHGGDQSGKAVGGRIEYLSACRGQAADITTSYQDRPVIEKNRSM